MYVSFFFLNKKKTLPEIHLVCLHIMVWPIIESWHARIVVLYYPHALLIFISPRRQPGQCKPSRKTAIGAKACVACCTHHRIYGFASRQKRQRVDYQARHHRKDGKCGWSNTRPCPHFYTVTNLAQWKPSPNTMLIIITIINRISSVHMKQIAISSKKITCTVTVATKVPAHV